MRLVGADPRPARGRRAVRATQENTQVIREDARVIEGQQRVLSSRPGLASVPINADGAVIAVHKVLERLRRDSFPRE